MAGRPGIAVGQTFNTVRQELVFDAETFKLLGERKLYDFTSDFHPSGAKPSAAATPPSGAKNGELLWTNAYLASAVVDDPGQRP
ncbi:hypothetical protein GCM10022221_13020 [Actinocorallia aurea]